MLAQWYLCNNCNGNASDIISARSQLTGTTPYSSISVWQVAANGVASGDGNILTNYTSSGTSIATSSFNTTYTNEICAAVGFNNGTALAGTAGTGFTLSSTNPYGAHFTAEHAVYTSTQTGLTPGMSWGTSGLAQIWEACIGY
jgi:hypothetical protein